MSRCLCETWGIYFYRLLPHLCPGLCDRVGNLTPQLAFLSENVLGCPTLVAICATGRGI